MKQLFIGVLLASLSVCIYAVEKRDFAYGYSLEVDGDGAIYTLVLTEDIYRGMTRGDRGDLRIFNSAGNPVPHYLRRAESLTRENIPDETLPYFPLYQEQAANSVGTGYNVHITTNEKGAIIDVNQGKLDPVLRTLKAYILDASKLEHIPQVMEIDWPDAQGEFVIPVRIEGSNDLNHWQVLVSRTTLSNLHYGAHALIQKRIELPGIKYKYLRLSWDGNKPLNLASARVQFPVRYSPQARQWSKFPLSRFDDKTNYYYFTTQRVLPADRLAVQISQRNTLVRVSIESASKQDGPWFSRYHGLIYDLQLEGNSLTTPLIHLSVNTDRFWRIKVLDTEGWLGQQPELKLGWIPEQLLFVAQGESPFTLAYGSASVGRVSAPLAQLLVKEDELRKQGILIKSAQLGVKVELGDESQLQPPRPPVDWKQYLLWAVLVLGVVALAVMVLRLYKQMESEDNKPS